MAHAKLLPLLFAFWAFLLGHMDVQAQEVSWQDGGPTEVTEGGVITLSLTSTRISGVHADSVQVVVVEGGTLLASPTFPRRLIFGATDTTTTLNVEFRDGTSCNGNDVREVVFKIDSVYRGGTVIAGSDTHTVRVLDNDTSARISEPAPNAAICLGATVDVNGVLQSGWSGTWSSVPDGQGAFDNASSQNTTFTPDSAGVHTLRWTITNNGCTHTAEVELNVVAPVTAQAGEDQTICRDDSTAEMDGNVVEGWSGQWYSFGGGDLSAQQNGSWTFSPANNAIGSDTLTWTLSNMNSGCPTSTDTLVIFLMEPPVANITTGDTLICQDAQLPLNATPPGSQRNGSWSVSSGANWFVDTTNHATTFTPDGDGFFDLYWTVSDSTGHCAAATDSLVVEARSPPNAGVDTSLLVCEDGDPVSLLAQLGAGTDDTGSWSVNNTTLTGHDYVPLSMHPGTYVYVVPDSVCGNATAQVVVTEAPAPLVPDSIHSVDDHAFCVGQYAMLSVVSPVPDVHYQWSCEGCEMTPSLNGDTVEVHWTGAGDLWCEVSAHLGNCVSDILHVDVTVAEDPASCPQGIVFFEPHGLAVLDPLADQFQWGTINVAGNFESVDGATAQTIFAPELITGSGDRPYYAVRTRQGDACWTTTTRWKDDVDHPCPGPGMVPGSEVFVVEVSPNPVAPDRIRMDLSGIEWGGLVDVDLFASDGRLVHRGTYAAAPVLTIAAVPEAMRPGVYVMHVRSGNKDRMVRLVIN